MREQEVRSIIGPYRSKGRRPNGRSRTIRDSSRIRTENRPCEGGNAPARCGALTLRPAVLEIAAMKALLCTRYGGPDDLELEDIPDPRRRTRRGRGAGQGGGAEFLRHADHRRESTSTKPAMPFSPAAEFAGVVESVGDGRDQRARPATACSAISAMARRASRSRSRADTAGARFRTGSISTAPPASASPTARRCTR